MFFKSRKPFRVTANFYIKVYLGYSDIINIRQLTVSGYDAREKIFQFLYWESNFSYPVTLLSYQEKTNYNYKVISMTKCSHLYSNMYLLKTYLNASFTQMFKKEFLH